MSRWGLFARRSSTRGGAPDWVDAPGWVVKHATRERWGEREWEQWDEICERFERWDVELTPDAAGGRLAIHAWWRESGRVSGEFIEADDPKPLNAALLRLVREMGSRVHRRAA